MSYKVEKTDITPEVATILLQNNPSNRKISKTIVSGYAEMMTTGLWGENISGICFAKDGTLLNGQHRLQACIDANFTLKDQLIISDLPKEAFDYIDNGYARTTAQILALQGRTNANVVATIITGYITYQGTGLFSDAYVHAVNGGRIKLFSAQAVEFLSINEWICKYAEIGQRLYDRQNILSAAEFGICYRQASLYSEEAAEQFFDMLTKQVNLQENSPALILLRVLQRNKDQRVKLPRAEKIALVMKAFSMYVQDLKASHLRVTKEEIAKYQAVNITKVKKPQLAHAK